MRKRSKFSRRVVEAMALVIVATLVPAGCSHNAGELLAGAGRDSGASDGVNSDGNGINDGPSAAGGSDDSGSGGSTAAGGSGGSGGGGASSSGGASGSGGGTRGRLLDLVFMIDNSPSMAPKVTKLNAQFSKLINALKDPNDNSLPDLRVAIIDSDLGTYGQYTTSSCGPKTLSDGNGGTITSLYGDMGRFQMINATSCGVTSPDATYLEYAKGSPVNFTPPAGGDINTVFSCLAGNLGTLGRSEEHQLQAYEFALYADLSDVITAQRAMLRPNAYLGLVFLTDEDDCSAAPNDTMFGDKPELRSESASLRCATRAHQCGNGEKNLAISPPGYPTDAAFSAPFASCSARMDTCYFAQVDVSQPTPDCSPLKNISDLATEFKSLKSDPDQILVAGIFGWPLSDADMARAVYKIDKTPNPNTQDTAHPMVWDYWPVCYDPTHQPADTNTFDRAAAGLGATGGLRNAAFVDQFGANGLTFSVCQPDFSATMKAIGDAIAKKLPSGG